MDHGSKRVIFISLHIQMQIRLVVPLIKDLQVVFASFGVINSSVGVLRSNQQLLDHLKRKSTNPQYTQLLKSLGFAKFSVILASHCPKFQLFGVTIYQPFLLLQILFVMLGQSMLKQITITFKNWSQLILSRFVMFAAKISWLIFIPSLCQSIGSYFSNPSFHLTFYKEKNVSYPTKCISNR